MTLRSRLAILAAVTTALTAIVVATFGAELARRSIVAEVDASLREDHARHARRLEATGVNLGLAQELESTPIALVTGRGRILRSTKAGAASFDASDAKVAQGSGPGQFSDRVFESRRYRFYSAPVRTTATNGGPVARADLANGGPGLALVVGRDVEGMYRQLRRLRVGFLTLGLGGVTLSTLAALLAVRVGTRPLKELNEIVQEIATEGDSPKQAPTRGPSDIARLSANVNTMIESLRESKATQQRMIDDAAHELRTPLTSMQTNIDILARAVDLDPTVRSDIVSALLNQFRELRVLVDDLGLLAEQHERQSGSFISLDLAEVTDRAVERARGRTANTTVTAELHPFSVFGQPDQLERAIINVLDNAIKWSPPGGVVTVVLRDGELRISDQGPGVPIHERERVFDRFWRATETRNTPGSGLGLSIVAEIVGRHRGTVEFGESDDGGALVTIRLPHFRVITSP